MLAEKAQGFPKPELPNAEFIFGNTPEMQKIRGQVERALQDDLPVLIEGESGTGKELVGLFLHSHSSRRQEPFVKVNCGAVPPFLLQREVFGAPSDVLGHEQETRKGSIGLASGGTLFFDEIGEMDLALQQRLVGTLQSGRYKSEGSSEDQVTKARFVCSSNLDFGGKVVLAELLQCFAHRMRLVPLRERKADIPQICEYLVGKFARNFGRPVPRLSGSVLDAFDQWNWPGNIRELENWIARIVIFGTEEAIGLEFSRQLGARADKAPRRHRATRVNLSRVSRMRHKS